MTSSKDISVSKIDLNSHAHVFPRLIQRGSPKHRFPMATFYVCSCYYTHNIFLQRYTLHCTFQDDEQFGREYRQVRKDGILVSTYVRAFLVLCVGPEREGL